MYFPLKHLGYKSVVVNLSDIYAMNATPKQITVSIAISNRFSVEGLEEFYAGIKENAPVRLTAEDGLAALQIALAALESARTGKAVDLTAEVLA